MTLAATIWDMDGVIVDSEVYWWESRVAFAAALGKGWTMDDQRVAMGRNTNEWARIMQTRLDLPTMPLEAIIEGVRSQVIARLETRLPTLPGAVDAVRATAAAGRIALASGSPTLVIDAVLRLTGLDSLFEVKVYGDTIANGKPAPDIYREAARRLGVDPAACVGIEDSGNGIRSLVAAGMGVIAVPSPAFPLAPELLAMADRVLPSLERFTPALAAEIALERAGVATTLEAGE